MRWLRGFALLLLLWLGGVFFWIWTGPQASQTTSADYALVLGAAVDDDQPSPVFQARIDHAISLWRQGRVQQIIFTGGQADGDSLSEAGAASAYALAAGVPEEAILREDRSRTTMENLVFALPANLQREGGSILLVSDPLHLRRASIMAAGLGYDITPSATPSTRYRSLSTKLPFALRELYFIHHYWVFGE